MRKRVEFSQNFLANKRLVAELLEKSDINPGDTVFEVGAGNGIITDELLKKAGRVVTYELDPNLFDRLKKKYQKREGLEIRNEDFLKSALPKNPYKIFSNIPFSITAAVIKKLTFCDNPPEKTYLVTQKEAAAKFAGKPLNTTNSQISVVLHPWFRFSVVYEFKPSDFFPRPNVNIILLEIDKRPKPLVENRNKYQDFVTQAFNQPRKSTLPKNSHPSELGFDYWTALYKSFLKLPSGKQKIVEGAFDRQLKLQESIEKVHRTRVDINWRKYKP